MWNERAKISWGLPSKEFSVESSLLLLCDDFEDDYSDETIMYHRAIDQDEYDEEEDNDNLLEANVMHL